MRPRLLITPHGHSFWDETMAGVALRGAKSADENVTIKTPMVILSEWGRLWYSMTSGRRGTKNVPYAASALIRRLGSSVDVGRFL